MTQGEEAKQNRLNLRASATHCGKILTFPTATPLTASSPHPEFPRCRRKNKEGRHVGLDFYDLLIGVLYRNCAGAEWRREG